MQLQVSPKLLLLLLSSSQRVVSSPNQGGQVVLTSPPEDQDPIAPPYADAHAGHVVDESILAALDAHSDPVDALVALQPDLAAQLAEQRLVYVFGEDETPVWKTEGDKLRLRREHKKFMDITGYEDIYDNTKIKPMAGKASKESSCRT